MRALRRAIGLGLLALGLMGCDGTTEPTVDGNCVLGLLRVDGLDYGVIEHLDGEDSFTPGREFATVQRRRGCEDVIIAEGDGDLQMPEPFRDGDANFLDPGTRIFEVPGYPQDERLAAEDEDGWYMLEAVEPVTGLIENGVQVRLFLDAPRVTPPATLTARLQYNSTGNDRATVASPTACPASLHVYWDTTRIPFPATEQACEEVATQWVLTPTDTIIREWSLDIGPDATPLEPGTYRVVADLDTHDQDLEVTFEVR